MRMVGLLWGSLLLSGVLCISGPDEITIPYGGTLSVTCSYDDGYQSYPKYWCKGEGWKSCEILIESEGRTNLGSGRYIISDSRQSITITAYNMKPEDSDVYWCGISIRGVDKMSRVNVSVRPGLCRRTSHWSSMVRFPHGFEMLSVNEAVEVSCREEYESRTFRLTCQRNSELQPQYGQTPCIRKCRMLERGKGITVTPVKEYYGRDEEVTLTCPEGSKPSHSTARCIRHGNTNIWNVSNVSCVKILVKCSKLELGKNINVTPDKEYYDRDEEVTLTCPEGYKPSHSRVRCIRDGETNTWNVSEVSCMKIPTPAVTSVVTPTVTLDMGKATNSSWKEFLVSCMFGLLPPMAVKLLAILVVIAVRASAFITAKGEQDMEISPASPQRNTNPYNKGNSLPEMFVELIFGALCLHMALVSSDTRICQVPDTNNYFMVTYGSGSSPALLELPGGVRVGRKIFYSNGVKAVYIEAKATCNNAGGVLATPQNDEENNAVLSFRQKYQINPFLGVNDLEKEGDYRDPAGNVQTFLPWTDANPDNAGGVEDCVEMINDNGKFNDIDCRKPRLTVCEFVI